MNSTILQVAIIGALIGAVIGIIRGQKS